MVTKQHVTVRVPPAVLAEVEAAVEASEEYENRSDVIRASLANQLDVEPEES
jgi:Arc/MetJ-type ribon-helix-helix transcriptional regulator